MFFKMFLLNISQNYVFMQQQVATVEQASCAQCWWSPTRGEPPLIR